MRMSRLARLSLAALVIIGVSITTGPMGFAQSGTYTPPPRGAPEGRVGGASRDAGGSEPRVALVIGIGSYEHLPQLQNPVNDAHLIAETLKSAGFELIGGAELTNLDHRQFETVIREFGDALSGGAVGLFYFAGHGVQVKGANYLVPVGANPTKSGDIDFELIDANLVLRQMEAAGSRLNFVILDACRNNPFGGSGLRDAHGGLPKGLRRRLRPRI